MFTLKSSCAFLRLKIIVLPVYPKHSELLVFALLLKTLWPLCIQLMHDQINLNDGFASKNSDRTKLRHYDCCRLVINFT